MYDLIVIGGGPGGYTGALEAVKLSKKVLLIEEDKLGGVCLNSGCIPTKSLLNSAKLYHKSRNSGILGLDSSEVHFNLTNAMLWKDQAVTELRESLTSLLSNRGIDIIKGRAQVIKSGEVLVNGELYTSVNILLATGSTPIIPDIKGIDSEFVVTSDYLLNLKELPHSVTVIGGGVIGLELGSFLSSIGVKVELLEQNNSLLPTTEPRIGKILEKSLSFNIHTSCKIESIDEAIINYTEKGEQYSIKSDLILIAAGCKPTINVDEFMSTSTKGVYAVGDCTGRSFLAHGAVKMAEIAVKNMFIKPTVMDFITIPSVIYCEPEVASVGLTVKQAKDMGIQSNKSSYHLKNNGRYRVENGDENGLCIVVSEKISGRILGIHIIGSGVSEVIATAVIAVTEGMTTEKFHDYVFPHPTLSESITDTIFFNN